MGPVAEVALEAVAMGCSEIDTVVFYDGESGRTVKIITLQTGFHYTGGVVHCPIFWDLFQERRQ